MMADVFERFTDRARRVVVLAQEEAVGLGHNHIGTEHLLLGLIRETDGVAARTLESMDISLETVRSQVEDLIGRGDAKPTGHIPFTPRAKKVLELSLREALQLGHNYIGTEHILLGLIREGEGVAARVLQQLGADLERMRGRVIELLSGYTGSDEPGSGTGPRRSEAFLKARFARLAERVTDVERAVTGLRRELDDLLQNPVAEAPGGSPVADEPRDESSSERPDAADGGDASDGGRGEPAT
jgi:ATP-dependent Clp protease ATP-binding subunit ClpA